MPLHAIEPITVDGCKPASAHVLEKLGMRREAHFREHQYYRNRWWDTLIYAILSHEWRELIPTNGSINA